VKAHELAAALVGIRAGEVRTAEEDAAAFARLTSFDAGAVYVGRFSGQSPWERHASADELLHVLEGAVDVTVLGPDGPARTSVSAGSIFVVPRGLWHRQLAKPSVTLLAVTPDDSEISSDDRPPAR
jgi:quercetin dioxygenase-like cupin family protein